MENRFSCSAGRAKLIDPNNFGLNLNDNFSVPLEDLNVSVILKSFRKGRTLLTGEDTGGISENIAQIDVNFIEGSDLGGRKVLTSKFTDLTTVFDKDVINDETLGITSIDIEFNSSYVPMITINFVDVRGSSIFQNEENILNNKGNKYTTFFQLPYPMFELEIKGFYGLPVKYCLHLLKFNSKFNSQTGNFEITCQFIGYTFALLSDMLLGYLRAIPYTKIGSERLSAYTESTGHSVLTLDALSEKISKINEGVKKEAAENESSKQINTIEEAKGYLTTIKNRILTLGATIDLNKLKTNYDFIIIKHVNDFNTDQKTAIDSVYIENVKTDITTYNNLANENYKLTEADFTNIKTETNTTGGKLYKKITIEELDSSDTDVLNDLKTKLNCKNDSELLELKKKILDHILKYNKDSGIGDTQEIDVFDMTLLTKKLDEFNKSLAGKLKEEKTSLAKTFANNVRDEFGFEPTIRPIVEIFTAAIEVFAESIFQVSKSAESNTERTQVLAEKFTVDDINVGDYHKIAISSQTFFPWPDYREKQAVNKSIDESVSASTENSSTYVEKYLGAEDVLSSPEKVDELVFIEDLLNAFRQSFRKQEEIINNAEADESTWYPVNAFDSFLFSESDPYTRYEFLNVPDIARIMVIRFMTFLGYSYNPELMTEEQLDAFIAGLAQIEIDAMLRGVKDTTLKKSISDSGLKVFKEVKGNINDETDIPVLTSGGGVITYNYIFNGLDWKILPVNKGFNSSASAPVKFPQNEAKLIELRDIEGYIFFTNYSSVTKDANGKTDKSDDGGTYIRIIDKLDSPKTLYTAPEGVTTDNTILLEKIKNDVVDSTAGFNPFGGSYGVQEFNKLDWGEPSLSSLPLMYVFYKDSDSGLALTRKASGESQKTNVEGGTGSEYFYNGKTKVKWADDPEEAFKTPSGDYYVHDKVGKNRELFNKMVSGGIDEVTYPYIECTLSKTRKPYEDDAFSLFGSKLYYRQALDAKIKLNNNSFVACGEYSRAYLFLHTLPFNVNRDKGNPFNNREILNLFRNSSGIIHAPRLWCAYVGAILWRLSPEEPKLENGKITGGGSGKYDANGNKQDPISWGDSIDDHPTLFQYTLTLEDYAKIEDDDLVLRLPRQVKREFIRVFLDFVNGYGPGIKWRDLADKLELFNTSSPYSYSDFKSYLTKLKANSSDEISNVNDIINFAAPHGTFKSTGNKTNAAAFYDIIIPLDGGSGDLEDNNLFLELRDNTPAVKNLLNALMEEVGIVNSTYKIWQPSGTGDLRTPIQVNEDIFDAYFSKVVEILKTKSAEFSPAKENEKADLAIFGTTNVDTIRLQLYRTCKNIYDKWLSGAKDVDSIIFQCGGRSMTDTNLAVRYTGKSDAKPRMIDSFRFVARNFRDIGDQLYINPLPINDMLLKNTNTSSYDMISKLLASNNFNFQPLPNFINFNDEKIMTSLFQPFNYGADEIPDGACGPSFVCVYAGQSSKHLDYGDPSRASVHSSKYPNDGFDLRCYNGNGLAPDAPSDIVTGEGPKNWEEPVSAFVVKYSQQNQNFFKDIQLDQSEFSETDESLKIQDEIAQKGAENNRSIVGQNIYNVYAVRSYTAKIEMMGNAMIQPMMFFQLDNIPMFHGAYLITKVSHSIKPNSMSTNFQGTRIRYPETPLVTAYDVYMSFLQTVDTTAAGTGVIGGSGGVPNSSAPILQTLIDNGCSGSNINNGNIKSCKVDKLPGVKFMLNPNTQMICEAVEPLKEMVKDWVAWMEKEKFKPGGEDKSYAYITSMFRTNGGSSMHCYGLALDFQFFTKEGNIFRNQEENTTNVKNAFDFTKNPALKWLYQHAYEYGFVQPHWANDGNKVGSSDGEEWWHWEYHGKAAIYQLRNRPIPAVGNNKASDNPLSEIKESKIKSFVHNPKGKDGKEAVYTNMDYKTTRVSDKSNKVYNSVDDYPKGPVVVKDQAISDLKVNANSLKFYDKLLDKLGAPKTDGNKFFLIAWHQIENSTCNWNAFNTKQQYGSSTACITSGVNKDVQNYTNMDEGVNGTYKTLTNGNYPNIIAALKAGIKTKQQAYDVAVELQKAPAGDLCVWKQGGAGCKASGGVPATTYVAQILGTGKMSGKSIAGSS